MNYLAKKDQKGLLIETSLSQLENKRLSPALRATSLPDGKILSSVSSIDILLLSDRQELRIAAISLSSHALRQIQDSTMGFD